MTNSERNFAQIEKELLSVVYACKRFDQYLVGNQAIIKTDHKPLINIFNKPLLDCPKRLQAMRMQLQRYNIELKYISGKENVVADALSRAPLKNENKTCDLKYPYIFKIFEQIDNSKYLNITTNKHDSK